ncbi:MAG: nucleotidyl transferase AbiEii/AbiGii toxin family protein [Epsilonproteobacteria bacterium]|jgi:predicted nucleotidyltransferase component of viral defense system|nr:nucleotidyl transferase AbiEii/AbiGii toxin family protein [Campylobacterota bacterium]
MSYQQIYINQDNLKFIHENYTEQIEALELFFKDAFPSTINKNVLKFGGGTALSIYYFQHRLSFDIDLFLTDQQYLSYFSPKHWIEDTDNFDDRHYIDTHNHIGVVSANNIKVDILVDSSSKSLLIDTSKDIFSFDIRVESIEDILAKKIVFRKKDNKARDIFDIAVAISKDNNIIDNLLSNEKITQEDLGIFLNALENINMKKYQIAIELVEPIGEYIVLANEAPQFIIEHIRSRIN